jgi:hypothetical protein
MPQTPIHKYTHTYIHTYILHTYIHTYIHTKEDATTRTTTTPNQNEARGVTVIETSLHTQKKEQAAKKKTSNLSLGKQMKQLAVEMVVVMPGMKGTTGSLQELSTASALIGTPKVLHVHQHETENRGMSQTQIRDMDDLVIRREKESMITAVGTVRLPGRIVTAGLPEIVTVTVTVIVTMTVTMTATSITATVTMTEAATVTVTVTMILTIIGTTTASVTTVTGTTTVTKGVPSHGITPTNNSSPPHRQSVSTQIPPQ